MILSYFSFAVNYSYALSVEVYLRLPLSLHTHAVGLPSPVRTVSEIIMVVEDKREASVTYFYERENNKKS